MAFGCLPALAQYVTGKVFDGNTGETLPGVSVQYQEDRSTSTVSDARGGFRIPSRIDGQGHLVFKLMGYDSLVVAVHTDAKLNVRMEQSGIELQQLEVNGKKKKYSRKNNPALDMIRKVIAAKGQHSLRNHEYYSYLKYEKMTLAANDVTNDVFRDDKFKRLPFLKEHVEVHPVTGKLILPLNIEEKVTQYIYKRDGDVEKSIVQGERKEGVADLMSVGEVLTGMMADCFQDVDLYEDDIRLFQYNMSSPVSSGSALRFYRYYLEDTLMVDNQKCYQIGFTPSNPQDFGFSGDLYVLADSTWRIKRAVVGVPSRSDINFVDHMTILQNFETLPTGEQVVTDSRMLLQLKLVDWVQKFHVERVVRFCDWSFDPIPKKEFSFLGKTRTDVNAQLRDDAFWQQYRPEPLSKSESQMGTFLKRLGDIHGFKEILWVAKAFVENSVETGIYHPSRVNIDPINTMIGSNWVEGFRLRVSAQTTAHLSKHWFAKGYVKYGFSDKRWKGMADIIYSFNRKKFLPREFPIRTLSFSYQNDVMSPSDKFLPTDKDNVFVAWKWAPVKHMNYFERFNLMFDWEWENGLRLTTQLRREHDTGAGDLFYLPVKQAPVLDSSGRLQGALPGITYSEATVSLTYHPGVTYVNTKLHRYATNNDAPVYGFSHTMGVDGVLGGEYTYNFTEASVYKRFKLNSWGNLDCTMKCGIQWNQVPYPFLIMPSANLSYIVEPNNFNLINNMEFLNDRYASMMVAWDLNGKILNRIPLIQKLKWREYLGCNMLWGTLTDKNNPEKRPTDEHLFHFPGSFNEGGQFNAISHVMDVNKPYVELVFGVHNIFKFLHVQYVRRINYLQYNPQKWGVRVMFRGTF